MWKCQKCQESHDDSFEACWNCGTSRDGTEDPAFEPADVVDAARAVGRIGDERLVCPKCGSPDVIPDVRILDRNESWKNELQVEVYSNPNALLFKGAHGGTLRASICGRCGYAELYVTNPQELLEAYQRSKEA
jgi:hypothetical protein